jgi:hypothetical protein
MKKLIFSTITISRKYLFKKEFLRLNYGKRNNTKPNLELDENKIIDLENEAKKKLTPMLYQYFEIKKQYPEYILLFR